MNSQNAANELPREAKKELYEFIIEQAKKLDGRIKPTEDFPDPNSFGFLFKQIKNEFGVSYKNVSMDDVPRIRSFVDEVVQSLLE